MWYLTGAKIIWKKKNGKMLKTRTKTIFLLFPCKIEFSIEHYINLDKLQFRLKILNFIVILQWQNGLLMSRYQKYKFWNVHYTTHLSAEKLNYLLFFEWLHCPTEKNNLKASCEIDFLLQIKIVHLEISLSSPQYCLHQAVSSTSSLRTRPVAIPNPAVCRSSQTPFLLFVPSS